MKCAFCKKELSDNEINTKHDMGMIHTNCHTVMLFIQKNIEVVKEYLKI